MAAVYFIPIFVAVFRRHRNGLAIGMLNILLGWTVLGWILALVWAFTSNIEPPAIKKTILRAALVKCPECAELIQSDARRCRFCQCVISPAGPRCGDCGREVSMHEKHCPACGFNLT